MAAFDSLYQLRLSTTLNDILIVVVGLSMWEQKIAKIGQIRDDIRDFSITSSRTEKWMAAFDWLRQLSLNAAWNDVLIVFWSRGLKKREN